MWVTDSFLYFFWIKKIYSKSCWVFEHWTQLGWVSFWFVCWHIQCSIMEQHTNCLYLLFFLLHFAMFFSNAERRFGLYERGPGFVGLSLEYIHVSKSLCISRLVHWKISPNALRQNRRIFFQNKSKVFTVRPALISAVFKELLNFGRAHEYLIKFALLFEYWTNVLPNYLDLIVWFLCN